MVSIEELREQLMSRIDTSSLIEVEKVERYIDHVESYRRMEKTIIEEGESVTTVNASQTFVKAHPLLTEKNKVNAAILNIERTFNFMGGSEDNKPKYTAEDLM